MNRIILIGNGFDRAHKLPTSYEEFITAYWRDFIKKMYENYPLCDDGNIRITGSPLISGGIITEIKNIYELETLVKELKDDGLPIKLEVLNTFLGVLLKKLDDRKWVDIENDYYKELKKICKKHSSSEEDSLEEDRREAAETLNKEFKTIEELLKNYLQRVTNNATFDPNIKNEITDKIYSPFSLDDLSYIHRARLIEGLSKELSSIFRDKYDTNPNGYDNDPETKKVIEEIDNRFNLSAKGRPYHNKYLYHNLLEWMQCRSTKEKIDCINTNPDQSYVVKKLLEFNNTLFLDFNYTNTTSLYKKDYPDTEIIHIHRELNNPDNPIIFGYGDEIGEDYKKIEDLEENELLKNVKSIRYQDTDNYQQLMTYIESDYYQVFIMGHSCGNSDRTLLNTLFEHENCLSIKPYYYEYNEKDKDGNDIVLNNYSDIVRNISRNFRDKVSMRSKVVNKTDCEPLIKYKKPDDKVK